MSLYTGLKYIKRDKLSDISFNRGDLFYYLVLVNKFQPSFQRKFSVLKIFQEKKSTFSNNI